MNYLIIKEMFDDEGWIRYNRKIAKVYGANAAILFGYLMEQDIYWGKNRESFKKQLRYEYSGEFFQSRDQIEEQVCITCNEQRSAEKTLTGSKDSEGVNTLIPLITVTLKPIKFGERQGRINYYKINEEQVVEFFNMGLLKNSTIDNIETQPSMVEKPHSNKNRYNKNIYNKNSSSTTSSAKAVKEHASVPVPAVAGGVEDLYHKYLPEVKIRKSDKLALAKLDQQKLVAYIPYLPLFDDPFWNSSTSTKQPCMLPAVWQALEKFVEGFPYSSAFQTACKKLKKTGIDVDQIIEDAENNSQGKQILINMILKGETE